MGTEIDVYKDWLGIPEGDRPPDHYQLLRLVRFEDQEGKVQANYKKLNGHVRKYATGAYLVQSQELLNELAKAMLCLTDPERKREYDESLGRVFDDDEEDIEKTATRYLVSKKIISRNQIQEVEDFADARGLSIRDAVVQMKLTDQDTATRAMAYELKLPFVDLEDIQPDDAVLNLVPRKSVRRHSILPLFIDDDVVLIACAEQPSTELEDEVRLRFALPMRTVLATPNAINEGIATHYAQGMREEAVSTSKKKTKGKKGADQEASDKDKPTRVQARKTRFKDLPPDEQQKRKQLGIIMMCWAAVGGSVIDTFLIAPQIGANFSVWLTIFLVPSVVFFVTKVYWK